MCAFLLQLHIIIYSVFPSHEVINAAMGSNWVSYLKNRSLLISLCLTHYYTCGSASDLLSWDNTMHWLSSVWKDGVKDYSALRKCFFSSVFYITVSDLLFLSSCLFLPLVKKHLAYACPSIIWKQITSFEFTNSTLLWILLMVKVSWDSPWTLNFWDNSRRDRIWLKTE